MARTNGAAELCIGHQTCINVFGRNASPVEEVNHIGQRTGIVTGIFGYEEQARVLAAGVFCGGSYLFAVELVFEIGFHSSLLLKLDHLFQLERLVVHALGNEYGETGGLAVAAHFQFVGTHHILHAGTLIYAAKHLEVVGVVVDVYQSCLVFFFAVVLRFGCITLFVAVFKVLLFQPRVVRFFLELLPFGCLQPRGSNEFAVIVGRVEYAR